MKRYAAKQDLTTKNARRILNYIEKNKRVLSPLLIVAHDFPDPDALASAYALQFICEKFEVNAKIVYGGVIGRTENKEMVRVLKIPARKVQQSHFKKFRKFALVDTQPGFENNSFPNNKQASMVIDQHHSAVKCHAGLTIIDEECGATSILLARALLLLKVEIPTNLATALAYGILTDTMNLYRATRSDVVDTYVQLMHYCDLKTLAEIQNPTRSRKFFTVLAQGVQKATFRRKLISSHLGDVDNPDLVSQMADFLLTYEKVTWSFCTGRYKDKLCVSLRSNNTKSQMGEVLRDIFDNRGEAGGHGTIAGGSFKVGNLDEEGWQKVEHEMITRLLKRLRLPIKGDFYYPFKPKAAPPSKITPNKAK